MTPTHDPWSIEDAANADIPEPQHTDFSSVPDGAWVLVRNATRDQKEGAQPKVITIEGKDGKPDWFKFKTAFIVEGGDKNVKPSHAGKYIFFECSTHKGPEAAAGLPLNGSLYNLILDSLTPEAAPAKDRWSKALGILGAKHKEHPEVPTEDTQLLYSIMFKEVLMDMPYRIVGQCYTPKPKAGRTFKPSQTLGSINAATVEVMRDKGIKELVKDDSGF